MVLGHKRNSSIVSAAVWLFIVIGTISQAAAQERPLSVRLGQAIVLEFPSPIKRVSLGNPEIVETTVATPRQLLINGKNLGTTSIVVWDEFEIYKVYRITVVEPTSTAQVMLHVRFAEVNRSALKEFGINLLAKNMRFSSSAQSTVDVGSFAGKVNTPSDPLSLSEMVDVFFHLPQDNLAGIIHALEEENLLTTLAKPTLSAVNGGEASFLAGGEVPVPVVTGSGTMQSVTIQWKEFGIKLKFKPQILDTTTIKIGVNAEVSSLDFDNGVILSGFRIPALTTRRAETTVELGQGNYLVIGGLLNRETSKKISRLPYIGKIPVLGLLFSSRRYVNKETELLIILSPEITRSVDENGLATQIRTIKNSN